MDRFLYALFRTLLWALNLLPLQARLAFVTGVLRLVAVLLPRYRRIAFKNLALAFPGDRARQEAVWRANFAAIARLLVDVARMHTMDAEWMRAHVDAKDFVPVVNALRARSSSGILFASGHLSSFELLAYALPFVHRPFRFVVRHFKSKLIDRWWVSTREASGNRVISREGAYKEIVRTLKQGTDVGVLFDQNVRREHAVFVPWFGRPAATTKAFAYAALATRAPVAASYLRYLGGERYRYEIQPVPVEDIYDDQKLSKEEKVLRITERASAAFQRQILEQPEGWFWMHRRWRTTPAGEPEDFYE